MSLFIKPARVPIKQPREKLDQPTKTREAIFPATPKANAYLAKFTAKGVKTTIDLEFTESNTTIYGVRKIIVADGPFKDVVLVTSWIWRDTMREYTVGNSQMEKFYGVGKP